VTLDDSRAAKKTWLRHREAVNRGDEMKLATIGLHCLVPNKARPSCDAQLKIMGPQ